MNDVFCVFYLVGGSTNGSIGYYSYTYFAIEAF